MAYGEKSGVSNSVCYNYIRHIRLLKILVMCIYLYDTEKLNHWASEVTCPEVFIPGK